MRCWGMMEYDDDDDEQAMTVKFTDVMSEEEVRPLLLLLDPPRAPAA